MKTTVNPYTAPENSLGQISSFMSFSMFTSHALTVKIIRRHVCRLIYAKFGRNGVTTCVSNDTVICMEAWQRLMSTRFVETDLSRIIIITNQYRHAIISVEIRFDLIFGLIERLHRFNLNNLNYRRKIYLQNGQWETRKISTSDCSKLGMKFADLDFDGLY